MLEAGNIRKRRASGVIKVLIVLLAVISLCSLGIYVNMQLQYRENLKESEEAAELAGLDDFKVPAIEELPEDDFDPEFFYAGSQEAIISAEQSGEDCEEAADQPVKDPSVVSQLRAGLRSLSGDALAEALGAIDLGSLKEKNSEIIGWIVIPGTDISYPILQHSDNEYYLDHSWSGAYNAAGAIFMEENCSPDFSDFNTIIYGHRMNNRSMFGALSKYKSGEYFDSHRMVYVRFGDTVRKYRVYAAFEPAVTDCTYWVSYSSDEHKQQVIDFSLEKTVASGDVIPSVNNQLLTLSTCTGSGHSTRWVVQAVLTSEMKIAEDLLSPAME